jgi:hypothetical protein
MSIGRDRRVLERAVQAGDEGRLMDMGETSSVTRLGEAGLVEWWQASPFIARYRATPKGRDTIAAGQEARP